MAFEDITSLPQNNPGVESLIDVNAISTSTPEGYVPTNYEQTAIENYNKQFAPQEIGAQPNSSLYPGLGHNINVGGYSGQVIGSGNIYVPGGNIMAINPMLARRKAIDDAARKRAAEISKPFEYQKPKAFKDARFQEKFNKDVYGFQDALIKEAQNKYGDAWRTMIKDQGTDVGRKFIQGMTNYETIVSNTDAITDMVSTIDEGLKDNSIYLSPEKRKVYDEYKNMLNDFGDYDKLSNSDFETLHSTLMGERDLNNYFNKEGILQTLEAKVSEYSKETDQGLTYVTKEGKTTDWSGVIKDLARELKQTTFRDSSFTEQDIADNLKARLKNQTSSKTSITEKNQDSVQRELGENIPDLQSGLVVYANTDVGKGVVKTPRYDKNGNILEGYTNTYRSLADFNMKADGGKNQIYVRDAEGNIVPQNFNGFKLDDIQILDDNGNPKNLAGRHYAKLGEISVLDNGDIVQKATIARPTTIKTGKGLKEKEQQTYLIQEEFILLNRNGKGTSAFTDIKTQLNPKNVKKYEEGYDEMKRISKKAKPSSVNNVSYTIKGKKYSLSELEGMGYSAADVEQYKD
jgi:hypothetical protein